MARQAAVLTMMMDARLSADARVLGYFIASKGEGVHEIPLGELLDVLSAEASGDRVRRALEQLARYSWVIRSAGGRGHSDRFDFRVPENRSLNVDRVRDSRSLSPTVVEVVVEEVVTPISPFSARIESAFEKHAALLKGCRGAVRDYIADNVPTEIRRYAYLQAVASWMDDGDPSVWLRSDGTRLPKEERPRLLAAALNELAAGDEKTMKRPVGDPANLKTKINILLKKRPDDGRKGNDTSKGSGTAGSRGKSAADTPITPIDSRRRNGFGANTPAA